ncbi:hypothetical protein HNQ27_17405 [Pseudomonas sp. B11D7D]|nr:hypothetical protein [Pseudomonas sp. B11D7D]QNH04454.1 hypothetical protein HNQ27_17405 [Pseudomonas sp. B11D7D]
MEAVKLFICIFLPPVVSALMIQAIAARKAQRKPSIEGAFNYLLSFNPEKGLIHQGPLWLSLITPFLYFLTLGMFSWPEYRIDISSDGFRNFFQISALPLAVLSTSIPLAALTSRLHATQQTALQISATKSKNNTDIFFSHRKALFEYFDRIGTVEHEGKIEGKYKAHPRLHKHAFGLLDQSIGLPEVQKEYFTEIERNLWSARTLTHHTIAESDFRKSLAFYKGACDSLYRLSYMLILPEIYKEIFEKSFVVKENKDINTRNAYTQTIGSTTSELIGAYRYTVSFYRILCEFSGYDSDFFNDIDNNDNDLVVVDGGKRYLHSPYNKVESLISTIRGSDRLHISPADLSINSAATQDSQQRSPA